MNHPASLGIAGIDTLPMAQRSVLTHPTNLEPGLTKLLSDHTRMGHARASITLDVYGHLLPSMQSEVAKLIDELVMPIPLDLQTSKLDL